MTHARGRRTSLLAAAGVTVLVGTTLVGVSSPVAQASSDLIADEVVEIAESWSEAGFVHPGIGLSAADLRSAQTRVRAGDEPWRSYFDAMADTSFASRDYRASNSLSATEPDRPQTVVFDQVGMRYRMVQDSFGALTQALMYVVTGDEVYRRNAIQTLRVWGGLDSHGFAYFADAHIHTGHPLYQFLMAAEIIGATEPASPEYEGYDVVWHENDRQNLLTNLAIPVVEVFNHSNERYMNQHNFGLFGRIATAIYADDIDAYALGVEWLTVNSSYDDYQNGAIAPLFPLIEADHPLNPYGYEFVQHQEMGRDQAHAETDVDNFTALARMLHVQGTTVDPVHGTVSDAAEAVSAYEFLDHRILHGAEAFYAFMMGEDVPFIDTLDRGGVVSEAYRGRLYAPLTEVYHQYQHVVGLDVALEAPVVARLHELADGPYYYNGVAYTNFWHPGDRNPEYWVALPDQVAGAAPAPAPADPHLQFANRATFHDDATTLVTEEGHTFARAALVPEGTTSSVWRLMYPDIGGHSPIGVYLRSDGEARLDVARRRDADAYASLDIPDTGGQWRYVTYDLATVEPRTLIGDNLAYYTLSGIGGTTVDLDHISIMARDHLTPPSFPAATPGRVYVVAGSDLAVDLSAHDEDADALVYRGVGVPPGASLDAGTAVLSWQPQAPDAGDHLLRVIADDGETVAVHALTVVVAADRAAAVAAVLADGIEELAIYTSASQTRLTGAREEAESLIDSGSDAEFAEALATLVDAADALELLSPQLTDGTLDFPAISSATVLSAGAFAALADGDNTTHTGDLRVASFVIDLGLQYRVSAEAFGLQARFSFPNRSAGTNVYGSDDGRTWTLLTARPTTETNDLETIEVIEELRHRSFRYLKLQVDQPGVPTDPAYPGLWSFAELRIHGERHEAVGTIEEVSLSSPDALLNRVTPGDTVELRFSSPTPISHLAVHIAGQPAEIASEDQLTWVARAFLGDLDGAGPLRFTIDHTTVDGEQAETIHATTDGTSLYASDESNLADLSRTQVVGLDGRPDPSKTSYAQSMFDEVAGSHSDVRAVDGEFHLVWDLGEGQSLRFARADVLARQDDYGLSRMADQALEGSNDLETWHRLTLPTVRTLEWQNLESLDESAYRYIRVRNDDIIGIAELRIFGELTLDLDALLATAEAVGLGPYSRGSAILFEREIAAVRTESQLPGADRNALAQRVLRAWDLLEDAPVQVVMVEREWVEANTPPWGGGGSAADNGWRMFDGDSATFTDTTTTAGWVRAIPQEEIEFRIDAVRFLPRSGYAARASGIAFEGSHDDGASWTQFATTGSVDSVQWHTIELEQTVSFGALRVSASAGNTNLAEVEFLQSVVDTTGLDLLLGEVDQLDEAAHTPESWQALELARQAAVAVLVGDEAEDQTAIDAATAALLGALDGLETIREPTTPEPPTEEPTTEEPTTEEPSTEEPEPPADRIPEEQPSTDDLLPTAEGGIVAPERARAGSTITVIVGGEWTGTRIGVWLLSSPRDLGTHVVGEAGTVDVDLPEDAAGRHRLAVWAENGDLIGWSWIDITADDIGAQSPAAPTGGAPSTGSTSLDDDRLSSTGAAALPAIAAVAVMLGAGAAVLIGRRRHVPS